MNFYEPWTHSLKFRLNLIYKLLLFEGLKDSKYKVTEDSTLVQWLYMLGTERIKMHIFLIDKLCKAIMKKMSDYID